MIAVCMLERLGKWKKKLRRVGDEISTRPITEFDSYKECREEILRHVRIIQRQMTEP